EGITYWPLADVVRQAAAIGDELSQEEARARIAALLVGEGDAALVAERVGAAVGLAGATGAAEEVFWAARKLLESLAAERPLGLPRLAPEFRRRIVETAGGNPLFVEEMLAMLLDLEGEAVEVPPTIQALLAARLDQLPTAERDALERAAVVGQEFSRTSLAE